MLAACAGRGHRVRKRRGTLFVPSAASLATAREMSGLGNPEAAVHIGEPSDESISMAGEFP